VPPEGAVGAHVVGPIRPPMLAVSRRPTLSASTCCGLFPRAAWLAWIEEAGFAPSVRMDPWGGRVYGQEDATESVMRLSLSPLPEPVG
jgi:hypothetical protein